MTTKGNAKNPFTAFSNFPELSHHHQQVLLNLILTHGTQKMQTEVRTNEATYSHLEWPQCAVKTKRSTEGIYNLLAYLLTYCFKFCFTELHYSYACIHVIGSDVSNNLSYACMLIYLNNSYNKCFRRNFKETSSKCQWCR